MSVFPGPSNAIVYAQFILQGRWRRTLLVAGIYGLLIGVLIWLSTIGTRHVSPQDMMAYVGILAALQIGNLLIFGSFQVERAVRGDVSSRMIESHRLMPTPPLGSILGYLFGAPLQAILLAVVNFILGAVCCVIGGLPLGAWVFANGALFLFAIFVHALVMQLAFIARGGFLLLLIVGMVLIGAGNTGALEVIPSLNVLLFPMVSRWSAFVQIFNPLRTADSSMIVFAYGSAFVGQAILAAVAVRVSVRRYLSPSVIGISPPLGLIVLATWVALALAQFGLPDRFGYRHGFGSNNNAEFVAQTVCSFATTMLLSMLPIASAAKSAHASQRGTDLSGRHSPARFSELWTITAAGAIMAVLLISVCIVHTVGISTVSLLTAFIVANFSISMGCLFSQGYRRRRWPWIIVLIWVALTWIGPVVIDAIYRAVTNNYDIATGLTALSPPGALALLWSDSTVHVQSGIAGQVFLTIASVGLLLLARRRRPSDAI